jgi:hypothetical protein
MYVGIGEPGTTRGDMHLPPDQPEPIRKKTCQHARRFHLNRSELPRPNSAAGTGPIAPCAGGVAKERRANEMISSPAKRAIVSARAICCEFGIASLA